MSNKIETWLKENHKDIYDEYLSSLNGTKRERERVILKCLSNKDLINYIRNGTLNDNITLMNQNTWNEPSRIIIRPWSSNNITTYYSYDLNNGHRLYTINGAYAGTWIGLFYNLQDNTKNYYRISGNMDGYSASEDLIWNYGDSSKSPYYLYKNQSDSCYITDIFYTTFTTFRPSLINKE